MKCSAVSNDISCTERRIFLRIFLVIFLIIFSQNIPHNISWDIFTWWGKEQEGRRRTRGLLRLLSTPALGGITSDHFYLPKITMILRGWFSSSKIRTTLRRRGDGYSVDPSMLDLCWATLSCANCMRWVGCFLWFLSDLIWGGNWNAVCDYVENAKSARVLYWLCPILLVQSPLGDGGIAKQVVLKWFFQFQ